MIFTAFYDLIFGPVSYDFVTWLVRAKKEAGDRALHVVIVPYEEGLGGFSRHWGKHDEHAARWRLWHIVVASCPLVDATVTVAANRRQAELLQSDEPEWSDNVWAPEGKAHFMGPLIEAARKGAEIPKLCATEAARRYVAGWLQDTMNPVVTLTLRNQDTDPDRNTDRKVWGEFAAHLRSRAYEVIVLDDTHVALSAGVRGEYAALDPDLRLALYERAAMNCIGNNGPQELLKFSDAPYLAFGQALTDGWQNHFRKFFSLEPGEQLPWARPDQRLVYRPDTFEVLKEEFERWAGGTR